MRLLTRRIYRAFPELDRYNDDQCRRFVAAASGSARRRAARCAAAIVTSLLWAVAPVGAARAISRDTLSTWVPPLWPFLFVLLAPAIGYLARDVLLRFRVRSILRDRGTCVRCRYSLIGAPVSEGLLVTCPECGTVTEVDSSLNELVLNDDGTRSFEPSVQRTVAPLITARTVRSLKRFAIGIAAVLVLVGGPVMAGYELFLRKQAARATAERPGVAGALALVVARQPKDADESPENNAWAALIEATTLRLSIENAGCNATSLRAADGGEVAADYMQVYTEHPGTASPDFIESMRLSRELALEIMPRFRDDGLYASMRAITTRTRAVRPLQCPAGQPLIMTVVNELGHCRALGRINFARMHLACAGNDPAEFADAFEAALAIARVVRLQCFAVDWQVATAIETEALSHARAALTAHPGWHARLGAVFDRQASEIGVTHALDGERLSARDLAAWAFSDPDNVRLCWRPTAFKRVILLSGSAADTEGMMGTYEGLLAETDAYFDDWSARAALPPWLRGQTQPPNASELEHRLLRAFAPDFEHIVRSGDFLMAGRTAFSVMLALERFRAEHGRYPASLEALAPEFLSSLPADPFTGDLPRYRLIDPTNDPHQRGYLAYFVGPDQNDNQGAPGKSSAWFGWFGGETASSHGEADLLFNDPR
ncbi:MAG: hypothetical protein ACOYN0_01480 [Phycisphaerales bacterium]